MTSATIYYSLITERAFAITRIIFLSSALQRERKKVILIGRKSYLMHATRGLWILSKAVI